MSIPPKYSFCWTEVQIQTFAQADFLPSWISPSTVTLTYLIIHNCYTARVQMWFGNEQDIYLYKILEMDIHLSQTNKVLAVLLTTYMNILSQSYLFTIAYLRSSIP